MCGGSSCDNMVAGGIMNDKEKLRHQLIMAKSLVKSNNKKIKEALEFIERILKSDTDQTGNAEENLRVKLQQFETIKEILEK